MRFTHMFRNKCRFFVCDQPTCAKEIFAWNHLTGGCDGQRLTVGPSWMIIETSERYQRWLVSQQP